MQNTNICIFTGNLTRDPELKFTNSGLAVCNFGIAVNTTLMGSGEPTNGDRLYVYRLISTAGYVPTVGSFADIPSVRLLISGQLKEEQEYQQLMRMRRTYELQQTYDED